MAPFTGEPRVNWVIPPRTECYSCPDSQSSTSRGNRVLPFRSYISRSNSLTVSSRANCCSRRAFARSSAPRGRGASQRERDVDARPTTLRDTLGGSKRNPRQRPLHAFRTLASWRNGLRVTNAGPAGCAARHPPPGSGTTSPLRSLAWSGPRVDVEDPWQVRCLAEWIRRSAAAAGNPPRPVRRRSHWSAETVLPNVPPTDREAMSGRIGDSGRAVTVCIVHRSHVSLSRYWSWPRVPKWRTSN